MLFLKYALMTENIFDQVQNIVVKGENAGHHNVFKRHVYQD